MDNGQNSVANSALVKYRETKNLLRADVVGRCLKGDDEVPVLFDVLLVQLNAQKCKHQAAASK